MLRYCVLPPQVMSIVCWFKSELEDRVGSTELELPGSQWWRNVGVYSL